MTDLERALHAVGDELDVPAAPDLAARVAARLRAERVTPLRRRARRVVALAAAAALLIGGTAVGVRFALRGVEIAPSPTPPPAPPAPPGEGLALGEEVTPAVADAAAPFEVRVPEALGPPDALFLDTDHFGGRVSMTYRPRPGLPRDRATGLGALLTQFRGAIDEEVVLMKLPRAETRVQRVTVGGSDGFWLTGAPHVVFYTDREGRVVEDTVRLAGNVLLWQAGDVTYRLEADVGRSEAIRIAESLR